MDLGTVSKMPLAEVNKNRSSLLIDSILIRAADRNGAGVPLSKPFKEDEEAIEGAYVHELNPGLYHWVCVLDFKSMYPSIIISKNICFTTISDDGTIISPTGAKFLDKKVKKGILPGILEKLMKDREEIKKKMNEAKNKEEIHYYDGLQGAIKIYMNSFYGVFASTFYRFTDKHIGASVTGFSRETTKNIIGDIESKGDKVLYSDTDSIFVKSPANNLPDSIEFGNGLAKLYSTEGGQLEFDKIFESMFSHGKKKRYVGKTVWPKTDMIIRGYEIRRTDSFDIQSDTMMKVFNEILDNKIEEAIKTAKDTVQDVLHGKVDVNKLIISKGCRAFTSYVKPDTQATVQTAKKLKLLGYDFIPGMKVSWIVTNAKEVPQQVTPYIQGRTFEETPDWKYYADRMAQTLARITEVYGINAKDLMAGNIQSTLTDDFKDGAKKKYTIEDFM
jgi:DNA polymerase I